MRHSGIMQKRMVLRSKGLEKPKSDIHEGEEEKKRNIKPEEIMEQKRR